MTTATASWYHCKVKPISRSKGRTAIAAAAYHYRTSFYSDEEKKRTRDYGYRGGLEATFIVAPDQVPQWAYDVERLWNEAQAKDTRKNSRTARECEVALSDKFTLEEKVEAARNIAQHLVDRYGVVVSVAIHKPPEYGDDRNYHAHLLFSTRRIDANGFGKKTRELDDKVTGEKEIEHIREAVATILNAHMEKAGIDERVDHRSYEDRGIDQLPTEHLGPEAAALERRGERTRPGDKNREIKERNRHHEERNQKLDTLNHELDELVSELAAIDAEISQELEKEFSEIETQPEEEIKNEYFTEEPEPTLSWEEQKRQAQDPFASELMKEFQKQIEEDGEIKEYGLGRNWYDRTVVFFENLYYAAASKAKDIWRYVKMAQVVKTEKPAQIRATFFLLFKDYRLTIDFAHAL